MRRAASAALWVLACASARRVEGNEIVANGGFDSGDLSGWTALSPGAENVSVQPSGFTGLDADKGSDFLWFGPEPVSHGIHPDYAIQDISGLHPNTDYVFKLAAAALPLNSPDGVVVSADYTVQLFTEAGTLSTMIHGSELLPLDGEYQDIAVPFTSGGSMAEISVGAEVSLGGLAGIDSVSIDLATASAAPEPSSLALAVVAAALGGAWGLGRLRGRPRIRDLRRAHRPSHARG